jgi:hypothetical protein
MSNVKVQMKSKTESGKSMIFDFLVEVKNILTFSYWNFI